MTMKPTTHKITITLRERTFVVAVLNEAAFRTPSDEKMVRHYEAAHRLASAIGMWPDHEGKVELVMSCADSRSVRALLDEVRHHHHVALGRPRAQQKLAILSSPDYEFRCGDAVLSGAEARQLQLKFGIRTPQKPKPTVEHAPTAGGVPGGAMNPADMCKALRNLGAGDARWDWLSQEAAIMIEDLAARCRAEPIIGDKYHSPARSV